MSYDIDLVDKITGRPVKVDRHEEGGTYAVGGITEASLNVTYNYGKYFRRCLDAENGIRWLYGRKAKDCIEPLQAAVNTLGTDRDTNYWNVTPGNAGYALSILLRWARQWPDAVFEGD